MNRKSIDLFEASIEKMSDQPKGTILGEGLRSELRELLREVLREEMVANGRGAEKDRLLMPKETAQILGESVRWLYRHADRLPFTRRLSRKSLRFSEIGLRRWMAARRG